MPAGRGRHPLLWLAFCQRSGTVLGGQHCCLDIVQNASALAAGLL